jgi:hypothetical protein
VYVARLRKELEAGRGGRRHIVTELGVGRRVLTDGTDTTGSSGATGESGYQRRQAELELLVPGDPR